jgi:Ca-activated chloride channel family protein
MDLKWPLLALLLIVLLPAAYWLLGFLRPTEPPPTGLPVAHAERLRTLPRFRELARQQLAWATFQIGAVGLVLVGSVWLAARPQHVEVVDQPARPGDLMLCLDLTAPQRAADIDLLAQARRLVGHLGDARIGLQGYQATAADLLPLTDDHAGASNVLHDTQTALASLAGGGASSGATGDGLVSCAQGFDRPAGSRGRAVVLLSADAAGSNSLHTLVEAAEYAAKHHVTLYAVPAGATAAARADLQTAAELTGGRLVGGRDALAQAWDFEQARLDPPPTPAKRDAPLVPTLFTLFGVAGLLVAGLRGLFR